MRSRAIRLLFDPTPTEGGNGNTTPPPAPTPTPDPTKAYEALLSKHNNDAGRLAESLHRENADLRTKYDALKSKVPGDGSVILSQAQAKAWTAYLALGEPKEVSTALEEGRTARAALTGIQTTEGLAKLGAAAKLNPTVFARLAKQEGLTPDSFETVKVKGKDGKEVETIQVKGEGDARTPLADFVDATWPEFKASLVPATGTAEARPGIGTPASAPRVVPKLTLHTGDESPSTPTVEQQLRQSGNYAL